MPVAVDGAPNNLYVGREYSSTTELQSTLKKASEAKFDFVVIPLFQDPPGDKDPSFGKYQLRPSTASDLELDSKTWSSAVVGTLSTWIDPDTKSTLEQQRVCDEALRQELGWASHLGVCGVILPAPAQPHCEVYASSVGRLLLGGVLNDSTQLMLRIPCTQEDDFGSPIDCWDMWNNFRTFCESSARLQVALELTTNLPPRDLELERWFAEPVRAVIVPVSIFVTTRQGHPVLPKRHQELLKNFFRYNVQVILQGPLTNGLSQLISHQVINLPFSTDTSEHLNHIARLFQSMPSFAPQDQFEHAYRDIIQAPLQPLQDNLESNAYETFEKDPVKYVQYQQAIHACLQDKLNLGKRAPFMVIVVGAGRGPLVIAVRSAASQLSTEVRIWAVEKNPNAIITLQHRKVLEEWDNVEVVGDDMRFWKAPYKADIIVSELLGSFGDNALSPECLDGAQEYLAFDGNCIPYEYTSYLRPVMSSKLWNDVRGYNDVAHFETAYIVKFHQAFYPTKEAKPCFTFSHPNLELRSNERYVTIDFDCELDALVHGFAGYFECKLYCDITLSTEPSRHSEGLSCWFPIYFPLHVPINVRQGQRLKSHWWRRQNEKKVWYEWAISEPVPQHVHNPAGRSYYIGK